VNASSPTTAWDAIRSDALARLERERIDPVLDLDGVATAVGQAVDDYQRRAHRGGGKALADPTETTQRLVVAITGFGPLADLLRRPGVEEIFIEGGRVSYLDETGRLQGLAMPTTVEENRQVVDRLLAATQRTLDHRTPLVQARVLDGTARLTASQPPISDELSATIRRHLTRRESLRSLVDRGTLTPAAGGLLWSLMQASTGVVISGAPGSGKTSLLAAMLSAAPSTSCIRVAEEIRELSVPLTHGGYYEARPPSLDGSGEVSLRALLKFLLAMRPDRIVVGEVRGAEAFELTRAVNAGCGFACTVHSNSARDALSALVNAATMAGENVREDVVRRVFASAIDVVVHVDREEVHATSGGIRRHVMEIEAVVPSLTDGFSTETLFRREHFAAPLEWTGTLPGDLERLSRRLPPELPIAGILAGRVSPL